MKFQRPKGTEDLYGKQVIVFNNIMEKMIKVAQSYNYKEMITPIFETSQLFLRSIGGQTDIIEKEIYDFKDKGGRKIALRPEGTAGFIRAIIENKLYTNQAKTLKYFYQGKMFRYERPQKGRNREFHQFGVEALGIKNPFLDIEIITLAQAILDELGINNYVLNINYFGSKSTKKAYQELLKTALNKDKSQLCDNCKTRIANNPLRVLDCKTCSPLVSTFPSLDTVYQAEEKVYFDTVKTNLEALNTPFKIEPSLVRGLDYYDGIIFEITIENEKLGPSQNTLVGGGRYDNLCEELGLPYSYPAIGFAFGIERLMLLLENEPAYTTELPIDLWIINQKEDQFLKTWKLITELKHNNFLVDTNFVAYSEKQRSAFLQSLQNIKQVLVFQDNKEIFLHHTASKTKTKINFTNDEELLKIIITTLVKKEPEV